MKFKSLLFASSLLTSSFIANAQEGKNADLKEVTNHLDMDGQFFMANNIEDDLSKIAALSTDYVKTARENGSEKFPADMDFNAILKDMGMDQLFAYGRSAKHAGDHWVSKMYMQNGGSTKGVFSMMGEKNTLYDVLTFAPSGADLVLEMNVDTRQLMAGMKNVPRCEKMNKFLNRKMPMGGTAEDMLKKFTAKVSVAVKLDDEVREVCPVYPEYNFPKLHGCMRMQGANQLWEQVGALAGWVLKIKKQEDGTLLMTPRRQKKGMNAVMVMDEKNDLLWVATSPEFLKECRSAEGAKISADAEFKAISGGITNGNMVAYISRQACLEIRQVKEAKYKKKGKQCVSNEMMKKIMDHLTESKNGYFAEIHKSQNGVNITLKAPCPLKEMMCGKGRCGRKGSSKGYGCEAGKSQSLELKTEEKKDVELELEQLKHKEKAKHLETPQAETKDKAETEKAPKIEPLEMIKPEPKKSSETSPKNEEGDTKKSSLKQARQAARKAARQAGEKSGK